MAIDKELFYASHGLKYPVVARPYTDDMEVKEVVFTKADMVDVLDKIRDEVCDIDDEIVLNPDSFYERKVFVRFSKVIEIIDKYKAESEEV